MSNQNPSRWTSEEIDEKIEGTPFTWRQALTQGKTGVIAIPTEQQYANIVRQANALDPVFRFLGGFTVTSWLRTPEHNKKVGGAPQSMHLTGLATDFVVKGMTADKARAKIRKAGLYSNGRFELDAATWIHADLKNNKDFYVRPPK